MGRARAHGGGAAGDRGGPDAALPDRGADSGGGRGGSGRDGCGNPAAPVEIITDRDREGGRGYYRDLCYKINARVGGEREELGDGGMTDWTQRLTANGKERLLISGVGIDRLAALTGP